MEDKERGRERGVGGTREMNEDREGQTLGGIIERDREIQGKMKLWIPRMNCQVGGWLVEGKLVG